jgi:AcrR family transcriptional regulator
MTRLSRAEQNDRNRALVLAAARNMFLALGYHGATVDKIAEEAGFSKGVVYSQFASKSDMFLALLEQRIAERARRNAAAAAGLAGHSGLVAFIEQLAARQADERDWGLLLIEFRTHAARDPELTSRYAQAHRGTIEGLAAALTGLYQRAGQEPPFAAFDLAQVLLALGTGMQLEQAALPDAMSTPVRAEVLTRIFAGEAIAARGHE